MPMTFAAIYLGSFSPRIDRAEGNGVAENASALVGQSFGSVAAPLTGRHVEFTSVNVGGAAGVLDQNNRAANDQAAIFDGRSTIRHTFDAGANYNGQITYVDGSVSDTDITLSIVQMANGDLYLVPALSGATNTALTAAPIRSIRIDDVQANNLTGMTADRPDLNFLTCFVAGTRLAGPLGDVAVEGIKAGDRLVTADHGVQVVRWVGMRRLTPAQMAASPHHRPVLIRAGALGHGMPARDLMVSPQHRILLRSPIVARMTGRTEALVAARQLVGCPGIVAVLPDTPVEYWHVLFDRHEVLLAEGCAAESLFLGAEAVKAMSPAALAQIARAVPASFCPQTGLGTVAGARVFVTGGQARRLVDRHLANRKALVQGATGAAQNRNVEKMQFYRAA